MLASSRNWISLQSAGDSENIGMISVLSSTYTQETASSSAEKSESDLKVFWNSGISSLLKSAESRKHRKYQLISFN